MDLINILRVARRWPAVILSVMLVTGLVTGIRLRAAEPIYEAQVKLQLTAPQDEEVPLYDSYRASNLRDEMTVARNNFTEVLESREVYNRTIKQLGLSSPDTAYVLNIEPLRDSDFLYVTVRARTPKLAEDIANIHTAGAILYFGEVRAKPATATRNYLNTQLSSARQQLEAAKAALVDFKVKNGIGQLADALSIYQQLDQQLQAQRDQAMIDGSGSHEIAALQNTIDALLLDRERAAAQGEAEVAKHYDEAITRNTKQLDKLRQNASPTQPIDAVIAQRRAQLAQLIQLEPVYNDLERRVQQAASESELLQNKYTEATLKENTIKTASNIQTVEPALAPDKPISTRASLILIIALLGSLGLGILVALLLEYITSRRLPGIRGSVSEPAQIGERY